MSHFSFKDEKKVDIDSLVNKPVKKSSVTNKFYHNIPIYDLNQLDLNDKNNQKEIYYNFFDELGVLIVKNVYSIESMNKYNLWCEEMLKVSEKDPNCRHPKQKGKYLINDIIGRMSENNPNLFLEIINNKILLILLDLLLGYCRFGSCTGHWIEPGVDRQLSHVDYPIHIGSGKFWENSIEKMKKITTEYQLNNMLTHYSVQAYIASDPSNRFNGSTEVIPGSHRIKNLDILLHNKEYYHQFEKFFINVQLEKGDLLIFNRRLCHRGGKNISNLRRNSLIIQCVWFWGIGQEEINYQKLLENLKKSDRFNSLSLKEQSEFLMRFKQPYPINVKNNA